MRVLLRSIAVVALLVGAGYAVRAEEFAAVAGRDRAGIRHFFGHLHHSVE